jgi:hypothetical protein
MHPSSRRRPGPLRKTQLRFVARPLAFVVTKDVSPQCRNETTRRMGPGLRRDDVLRVPCGSPHHDGAFHSLIRHDGGPRRSLALASVKPDSAGTLPLAS